MFEYDRIKQELQYQLSPIDFMHVSSLFLVSNDKAICKNDKIHGRKLQKLIPNIHEESIIDNASHDPNKVIYNFSNYHLTINNHKPCFDQLRIKLFVIPSYVELP